MNKRNTFLILFTLFLSLFPLSPCFAYTDSAEADVIPWSGFWWPTTQGGLATGIGYRGEPAPIQKYELLKNGYYPGEATRWELENNYDLNAFSWAGLCLAWSSAAVTENIDFKPSSNGNIIFFVGDKKGLITACHGSDLKELASGESPEVFHQWLLHYIKDQGLAFAAELDPSEEFWSYPMYKYSMDVSENGGRMSVSCQVWYADDMVDPDFQGTKVLSRVYTYDLFRNSDGEITGGEWSGLSTYNHPGLMWRPVTQVSTNPYLEYTFIKQIAESRDDPLEDHDPVDLTPGVYNLVLLDEDGFTIRCNNGDTIFLAAEKTDDFPQALKFEVLDADGMNVITEMVNDREEASFVAENPPYQVMVSLEDYGGGGAYALSLDLKTRYEFLIPHIQKGGAWLGFGLTNGGESTGDNINIVGCRKDGTPIKTLLGPFSLPAGAKRTFLLSQFPMTIQELKDLYSIRILSPLSLSVVSLNGNQDRNMFSFNGVREGSRLIIPDLTNVSVYNRTVWWGVSNKEAFPLPVRMMMYSPAGMLLGEKTETIPAQRALSYSPSESPFYNVQEGSWVLIEGQEGMLMEGYISIAKASYEKGDSFLALNLSGQQLYLPHIAANNQWKTTVTVINISSFENPVVFSLVADGEEYQSMMVFNPFEKKTLEVRSLFPSVNEEVFNRSSLWIESAHDTTGFYAYETSSSLAYYPLMSEQDVHEDLVVTHVASDGYWWTGVGIINPGDGLVSLSVAPYGNTGEVMADQVREITLYGKEKEVFCVDQLFDLSRIGDISFLKVKVTSGAGVAGLFMYGDRGYKVLSGAMMQGVE